jgi:hypothetical protein
MVFILMPMKSARRAKAAGGIRVNARCIGLAAAWSPSLVCKCGMAAKWPDQRGNAADA